MRQLIRSGARLFWRRPLDEEVDDELSGHIELLVRRLVHDGMTPEEARAAANQRFGDLATVRAECHTLAHDVEEQMTRQDFWQQLRQDVAYGARTLRRSPLYTTIAVLTLALGIGAGTAIFSVVHAVLLRALPYRDADRVIAIWNSYRQGGEVSHTAIAPAEFADVMDQNRSFDAVAAVTRAAVNLTGSCGGSGACEPERVNGYVVSTGASEALAGAMRDLPAWTPERKERAVERSVELLAACSVERGADGFLRGARIAMDRRAARART